MPPRPNDGQGPDNNAEEDGGLGSDSNAHEPETGSSDAGDLGEDEDHQTGPAEESPSASDAQIDTDMTAAEDGKCWRSTRAPPQPGTCL